MPASSRKPRGWAGAAALGVLQTALLLFAAITWLGAARRDLPHAPGSDEVDFLLLSAQIAATGDLNPHWFGHPGSTFLYPYAAVLHADYAITGGGPWLEADAGLIEHLDRNRGRAVLLGRLVSIAYALLAVWLVCRVGDRAFGAPVGLVGAWLAVLSPITLEHVTQARTDGAGLFFGFLAMAALLRLLERPSRRTQATAGMTLGLAIATRFFLVALLPLLLWVEAHLARRSVSDRRIVWLGLAGVAGGLVLGAPYLLPELPTVLESLAHETRTTHPGADGLGFWGNLAWYLSVALPHQLSWPVLALALAGAAWTAISGQLPERLLLAFTSLFLVGISLAPLHWGRWLVQILPLLALFAGASLVRGLRRLAHWAGASPLSARAAIFLGVVLVSAVPAYRYVEFARRLTAPSTRERGREWILHHLDPRERIAADLYTAPLQDSPFDGAVDYVFSWAQVVGSPTELRARGYDVAIVSSAVYGRFLREPKRYPAEVAFYRSLFREHELLAEFRPDDTTRGPVVRVYPLKDEPAEVVPPRAPQRRSLAPRREPPP